jgi:hypothetical protein
MNELKFGDLRKTPEATRQREIYAIRMALDQMVHAPRYPRSPGLMTRLEHALHKLRTKP